MLLLIIGNNNGPIKDSLYQVHEIRFYNLFWGAKVTVQMRVLSAPTFFSIKK